MKVKNVVSIILLLFVGVSVACLVISESSSSTNLEKGSLQDPVAQTASAVPEAAPAAVADETTETGPKLVAYYFHRTQRCRTCLAMEGYAEEALTDAFPEELESGQLEWHGVNIEEPANEHFVLDYQLTSSALVMVYFDNGEQKEWKNLDRVWDLVGDKMEYQAYVEGEALAYLEFGP